MQIQYSNRDTSDSRTITEQCFISQTATDRTKIIEGTVLVVSSKTRYINEIS